MSEPQPNLHKRSCKSDEQMRRIGAYTGILLSGLANTSTSLAGAERRIPKPPTAEQPLKAPEIKRLISKVEIIGNQQCQSDTKNALTLLGERAPFYFKRATKYIGVIDCESKGSGMYAYENPPRFVVGNAQRKAGVFWYASVIAHDATHSELYHDYLSKHPHSVVPNSVWIGKKAENVCNKAQLEVLKEVGASQYYIDYLQKIRNSDYWDVPVSQRP